MVFYLPPIALSRINDCLDEKSRNALMCTSHGSARFKGAITQAEFFKRIVAFILENYQVNICSRSDPLAYLFHNIRVLGLGETHSVEEHLILNAILIKTIWAEKRTIYLEGGKNSVEVEIRDRSGHCKYLDPSILRQVASWDLQDKKSTSKRIGSARAHIELTQQLEILSKNVSRPNLIAFCEKLFQERGLEVWMTLNRIFPDLDKLDQKSPRRLELQREIIRFYVLIIIKIREEQKQEMYGEEYAKEENQRNKSLADTIWNQAARGRSPVIVAGSAHISDPCLHTGLQYYNKCFATKFPEPFSFMLLTPKPENTQQSIKQSYERIFGVAPKVSAAPVAKGGIPFFQKLINALHPKEQYDYKKILDAVNRCEKTLDNSQADIQYLRQCLAELKIDNVDASKNHFGIWVDVCDVLLQVMATSSQPAAHG